MVVVAHIYEYTKNIELYLLNEWIVSLSSKL